MNVQVVKDVIRLAANYREMDDCRTMKAVQKTPAGMQGSKEVTGSGHNAAATAY